MPWLQISFTTIKSDSESLSDILSELGAASVTFQDAADEPILEPGVGETPLWQNTVVTALFAENIDSDEVLEALKNKLHPSPLPQHSIETLEDKAWEREWMKDFQAMQFGKGTWICPSWQDPPQPDAVNIMLDPGLAFGTGTHPTTALCLEWMDQNITGNEVVIDFGCGSGILAICALLHGAEKAVGIDNDPQALIATRENASKNKVINQLEILSPDQPLEFSADIVVANILAKPLVELAQLVANYTKPNGIAVLSGILEDQSQMVIDAYLPWFKLESQVTREQWVRLDLRRTNHSSQ